MSRSCGNSTLYYQTRESLQWSCSNVGYEVVATKNTLCFDTNFRNGQFSMPETFLQQNYLVFGSSQMSYVNTCHLSDEIINWQDEHWWNQHIPSFPTCNQPLLAHHLWSVAIRNSENIWGWMGKRGIVQTYWYRVVTASRPLAHLSVHIPSEPKRRLPNYKGDGTHNSHMESRVESEQWRHLSTIETCWAAYFEHTYLDKMSRHSSLWRVIWIRKRARTT